MLRFSRSKIFATLAAFNVRAERREDRVGVWVRDLAPNSWPWIAPIVTIGLATVSWFLVERPFNRFKARRAPLRTSMSLRYSEPS